MWHGLIEIFASQQSSQRKDPSAQSLSDHQHVRHNAIVFTGEHAPRSTKTVGNFIQNEKRTMAITGFSNALPVIRGRNERRATHGFCNHSRHISLLFQDVFHVIRAGEVAFLTALEWTMSVVGWRHMLTSGQKGPHARTKNRLSTDGNGIQRSTMKGIPHGNGLVPSGRRSRQLECHAHGGCSPGSKKNAVEITGCQ